MTCVAWEVAILMADSEQQKSHDEPAFVSSSDLSLAIKPLCLCTHARVGMLLVPSFSNHQSGCQKVMLFPCYVCQGCFVFLNTP